MEQERRAIITDHESSDDAPSFCTFPVTGKHATLQTIYVCHDCSEPDEGGMLACICQGCADICHFGHDVEYMAMGPSYCDCQDMGDTCSLKEASRLEAERLGIPTQAVGTMNAPAVSSISSSSEGEAFLQEVFSIPSLETAALCDRLVEQAIELVKHTRDTHWIDAVSGSSSSKSFSDLENLARAIFQRHVKEYRLCVDDEGNAAIAMQGGAEWWVQVKKFTIPKDLDEFSPLEHVVTDGNEAVDLHYDKDEALAESFGLGSFPILSTVTYLTDSQNAAPTIVFPHTYNDAEEEVIPEMLLSRPRRGKHLVFDGRLLHGAPAHHALRAFDQLSSNGDAAAPATGSVRVTFLVNVWLSGRPSGVTTLPQDIRERVMMVVGTREGQVDHDPREGIKFEKRFIPSVDLLSEENLPQAIRGRIELPFVSKGAIWVEEDEDAELVLVTFPPPPMEADTVKIRFGPGLQAYLDHLFHDDDGLVDAKSLERYSNGEDYV